MATSTRKRKITRSTNQRVKRKMASKHVRRILKRKISKRKVMKGGGDDHFKVYLVSFTETKGLFSCPTARLPVSVLGLLFYSEVNNDFFYFGCKHFGLIQHDIFLKNPEFKIFTPQNNNLDEDSLAYSDKVILDEDLAFIGHLCGLSMESAEIKGLKSRISSYGILSGGPVKYCVNLNRTWVGNNLELGYCSTKTTSSSVSDDAYDNRRTVSNEYKIEKVGNLDKNNTYTKPVTGEIEISIDGVPCYFFLEDVTSKYSKKIPRGVSVIPAIKTAMDIIETEVGNYKNQLLYRYQKNRDNPIKQQSVILELQKCLDQMKQQQLQEPQQQEPQQQPQPQQEPQQQSVDV